LDDLDESGRLCGQMRKAARAPGSGVKYLNLNSPIFHFSIAFRPGRKRRLAALSSPYLWMSQLP